MAFDSEAVKALSQAVFKTENNLHFVWLKPLLEEANALGQLDELPDNMHYTQAVKRIRQFALLIKQQQLDINEINLALEDQDLVAKFPEDLILPNDPDNEGNTITSVDTLLETDEFFPEGIDAAFADQRQVNLFKGDSLHVTIGDEDNYKQYDNDAFVDVQAAIQERGENYVLSSDTSTWYQVNHLEARTVTQRETTPRTVQRVEELLEADAKAMTDVSAVLHGSDGKSYVFAGYNKPG